MPSEKKNKLGYCFEIAGKSLSFYCTFILNLTSRLKPFGTSEYFHLKELFVLMSSFVVQ